ncbi:MAG TPA: response regulator transcription factor [Thermoanaerobaculia bacterium]|nr:response regulator transcription factor [Thermoanaerobaculia bacterium]
MTVRIVLADDHPVVRRGLAQFFSEEEDLEVVAECEDGQAALSAIRRMRPDVAVVDLRMPVLDGISLLRRLAQEKIDVRPVILAGNISDDEVVEAMRLGVKGIVLKEMAPKLLVQCIRKVASGGTWLEKDAVGRAMERLLQQEERRERSRDVLTQRELEIVKLTAAGHGNREIAEKLFISEGTVKTHLHTIYEKLGLKSRVQLAAYARDNGLA